MGAAEVIDIARRRGIDLHVVATGEGPRLAARGPDGVALDEEARRSIREHRDEIIRLLTLPGGTSASIGADAAPASSPPPPAHHLHPPEGTYAFTIHVDDHALAEVERIRSRAHACGWTDDDLLQNRGRIRFPCGEDWGLVCFLRHGQRVGEVTERAVELVLVNGVVQHFQRPRRGAR